MGGSAPSPDPQMGEAAKMSAETGRDMLDFMKGQADITNQWAADDRQRYTDAFRPLEDSYIDKSIAANDPRQIEERAELRATEAVGDVRQQFALSRDANSRRARSMGVNPNSGRAEALDRSSGNAEALAAAGASNLARRQSIAQDEARGDAIEANTINLGKGMAVNPATSMGLSNGAAQAGFSGAQAGYGQQASILNKDYESRLGAWQSKQAAIGSTASGLGALAGAIILSSKEFKENKKPATNSLGAVRKMPVEEWTYKEGMADEGTHIGPYAEDFADATGMGDGKSIDAISLMGLTLGAVKELDAKVSKMEKVA
jgi:hypothetical protein